MNETTENGYLSNPYVLIGGALLIYWFIQRRNLIRANENSIKSLALLYNENSSSFNAFVESDARKYKVPTQLVKDAKKMSKKECAKAILDNQKMKIQELVIQIKRNYKQKCKKNNLINNYQLIL